MALTSTIYFPALRIERSESGHLDPEASNYARTPIADVSVFTPEAGPDVLRRRTGRTGYRHVVTYLLDTAELRIWDTFFRDTIKHGALAFNWADPYDADFPTDFPDDDPNDYTDIDFGTAKASAAAASARWFFGVISTAVEAPLEGTDPTAAELQAALDSPDVEEVTNRIRFFVRNTSLTPIDLSEVGGIGFRWDGSGHSGGQGAYGFFFATTADIDATTIFNFTVHTFSTMNFAGAVSNVLTGFTIRKQIADADGVIWNVWGIALDSFESVENARSVLFNATTPDAPFHLNEFSSAAAAVAVAAANTRAITAFNLNFANYWRTVRIRANSIRATPIAPTKVALEMELEELSSARQ